MCVCVCEWNIWILEGKGYRDLCNVTSCLSVRLCEYRQTLRVSTRGGTQRYKVSHYQLLKKDSAVSISVRSITCIKTLYALHRGISLQVAGHDIMTYLYRI
jgi:hypothetical protein